MTAFATAPFRPLRPLAVPSRAGSAHAREAPSAEIRHRPVYVDAAIHRRAGRAFCHMFSEDPENLRAVVVGLRSVARRLGVHAGWFDGKSWPHYDLPSILRDQAIVLGAVPADRYTTLEVAWRLQGRLTPDRAARLLSMRARASAGQKGLRDQTV